MSTFTVQIVLTRTILSFVDTDGDAVDALVEAHKRGATLVRTGEGASYSLGRVWDETGTEVQT